MKLTLTALAACLMAYTASPAAAQTAYPEKCKGQVDSAAMPQDMPMDGMTEYQKASMDGMKSMNANMMQGMMKKGADMSFVCGMIAHHLRAISMSEVELKYGEDGQAKAKAQKIIDDQTREVQELTKWVDSQGKQGRVTSLRSSKVRSI